jgi:hypothetical protein
MAKIFDENVWITLSILGVKVVPFRLFFPFPKKKRKATLALETFYPLSHFFYTSWNKIARKNVTLNYGERPIKR